MKKHLTRRTNIKQKRVHGFRRRMSTRAGCNILSRRRKKGRWRLTIV